MDAAAQPGPACVPPELEATDLGLLVEGARLEDVDLSGALAPGTVSRAAAIIGGRLTGSLAGAQLHALHVHDLVATGGDLANLDAHRAELQRVALRDCRLTGAQLTEAGLRDVTITGCRLDLAVLAEARLERVVFTDCVLTDATLDRARLRDVRFERCDLSGATLDGIRLERVDLAGCRLAGVRHVSDLRGARMPAPDIVENAPTIASALGIEVLAED